MTEAPTHPSRWLKWGAGAARWALALVLAFWVLVALAWGGLHFWIVPRIDDWRPLVQRQAQRALGMPVRIGHLAAHSEGVFPTFELGDVTVLDPEGREALRLPRVRVALSPRSLLRGGVEQLYIDQPMLQARRDANGRWFIAGWALDGADGDGAGADWVLSQTEVVVHDGTLRWEDALRGAPPVQFSAVDVLLRGGPWRHALRVDATPPPDWGARLSVRAQLQEPLWNPLPRAWERWSGQAYAEWPQVDFAQLAPYVDLGATTLDDGHGALRAWLDVRRGHVTGATADVALGQVQLHLAGAPEPLALAQAAARLEARRAPQGLELTARDLKLRTDDGLTWNSTQLRLVTPEPGAPPTAARYELHADRVDLAPLARIASRLPLADALRDALARYAPEGAVKQLQVHWQGLLAAPTQYDARGRFTDLALAAHEPPADAHAPQALGVRGARGDFALTQAGGTATLAITDGALRLPGVFEDPDVPVQTLAATVRWQIDGARAQVQTDDLRFANADAEGEARLAWHTGEDAPSRLPGVLDLSGRLSRANGARVYRYLPLAVGAEARHYVRAAIAAGTSDDVQFRVKGDLRRLPFDGDPSGEFHIAAQVRDTTLAYVPASLQERGDRPWPALTGLSGTLVFDRAGMRVEGAAGSVAGHARLKVAQVGAHIADLSEPMVQVDGTVRGPLADMLAFVRGSQVSQLTDGALDAMSATGDAALRLELELPVADLGKAAVRGSVQLAGNEVRVAAAAPVLAQARGAVQFTERGFTLQQVRARALGGEVRLSGGLQVPAGEQTPVLRVQAQGEASAEGLRAAAPAGALTALLRRASGSTAYTLTLGMRNGEPQLLVTSDLRGLALDVPAPLGKSAEQAWPMRWQTRAVDEPAGAPARERWTLGVQGRLALDYLRAGGADPTAAVLAGRVALGAVADQGAPLPQRGVEAAVALDALDVDAWRALLASAPQASAADAASAASDAYLPERVTLKVGELTLQGRALHEVAANLAHQGSAWRGSVSAQELEGHVEYHAASPQAPQGRVYARLSRLALPRSADTQVDTLLDAGGPSELPELDIEAQDLSLRDKHLGRLELQANNRVGDGGAREWRLARMDLHMPEATFTSSGNWALLGGAGAQAQRRTALRFALKVHNSGALLTRLGMPGVLDKGEGTLEGQIGWLGSPVAPDYPSMTGQMKLDMAQGRFLKADPGLSKLLGVLSLQALPRRLALDFRDIFSAGFSFDFVRADVHVDKGIASTNNLQMKGVNAAVLMEGNADIAHETQDLRVVVVPELNTLTASLVATAINPVVGLGSFFAQYFLRGPLVEAATQEFHIDGTWDDPRVERVKRAGSAPAPKAGDQP